MKKAIFQVEKSGIFTTIQDLGRYGYQQYGVVVSGAMDQFAHRIANILVGNKPSCATLEMTLIGPTLHILEDCVIAITGANLSATIDNKPLNTWKSTYVKKGQILSFGKSTQGILAYLAVSGGIYAQDVLGSKATYRKAKIGGIAGREIRKGDILFSGESKDDVKLLSGRILSPQIVPNYQNDLPFRVIVGPDEHLFSKAGLATFFREEFEITTELDRMGCRLLGPIIEHNANADILSDAITFGTIQVPANGQPIILLAERQTSGGYARIGSVITVDLPRLVQQPPRTKIRFEATTIEKAHQLYISQEKVIKRLEIAAQVY